MNEILWVPRCFIVLRTISAIFEKRVTDGRTDGPSYRDEWTRLKIKQTLSVYTIYTHPDVTAGEREGKQQKSE